MVPTWVLVHLRQLMKLPSRMSFFAPSKNLWYKFLWPPTSDFVGLNTFHTVAKFEIKNNSIMKHLF
jgi:hypothetical protein